MWSIKVLLIEFLCFYESFIRVWVRVRVRVRFGFRLWVWVWIRVRDRVSKFGWWNCLKTNHIYRPRKIWGAMFQECQNLNVQWDFCGSMFEIWCFLNFYLSVYLSGSHHETYTLYLDDSFWTMKKRTFPLCFLTSMVSFNYQRHLCVNNTSCLSL